MSLTNNDIETLENDFYAMFLNKAIEYAEGGNNANGIQFKQIVAAAGVVAKQKQTRSAMKALAFQIASDTSKGIIKTDQIEFK